MSTPDLHDDELPPELRSALRNLPREREPGRLLEERTLRALREHGVIEAAAPRRGIRRLPASWLGGAVAAGLALFASGMAVGQWMGTRATAQVVSAVQAENSRNTAMLVQQTGTAYVQALSKLATARTAARMRHRGARWPCGCFVRRRTNWCGSPRRIRWPAPFWRGSRRPTPRRPRRATSSAWSGSDDTDEGMIP